MKMRLRLIIAFLCLTPILALANACTYSGASGNFRTIAWVSCGGTYPGAGDTAAISGAGVVVTVPLGETDSIGTTGGTTPHPVLTVSGSAGLVILGTLTAGNQSGVQTNDIKVTGSGSFILNRGTFNQQGDLDLDTSAEFDACAGGVHSIVSSGTTILNRITGTNNAVPYPLWNMHSTRCALYGGAIPSSPVGTPCTDAGGGANCYHMQVPTGTAFQFGQFLSSLIFDANSLVFDSPNSTYGTCGKAAIECAHVNGFWCRNTTFNFTGEVTYASVSGTTDPGLDWSADVYGQGCEVRNPLGTGASNIGLYCGTNTAPGTYQGKPTPRRIEWATFDVDAGEHNYGYTSSLCPGLDVNNVVSSAEFTSTSGGTQLSTNYHDMLFLRPYNFTDTFAAYFLPGAGLTYTNMGFLSQGPKTPTHSHMVSEGPPAGANFGQNYTACNTYKNLFFEGSGDLLSHDNMMVNSTCIRYQGGIFDHNFTNFIDNNNSATQCNSCNSSGAEHVTIVDNNNSADPTSTGFEPWEVQPANNRLGVNKVEEINSFLAQSVTGVIGHSATTYTNNTDIRWMEQPAYGSANITSVVVTNPNMTINVDSSTPFQSSTHGQVNLISVLGTGIGGINESPGNCTVGTVLTINSGNNDATFQVASTSGSPGPITGYTIITPGTGYTANRYSVAYTTSLVSGTACSIYPVVSVATGDVWARLGCTMQTGYGIQSTAATVLNCHHFFVTATTSTSVTAAIPPGVTLADGTYITTGIIEKGFNYDYNAGGDWQTKALCGTGTPNLWNTAAGGIDGIPFSDPNISTSCNFIALATFNAASTCTSPCTSLSANAITGHPFAVNQVVIDRSTNGTTTALITAVSGSGPYTLTLGPNNQTGTAGLGFTVNTSDTLVLMRGIWDSTAPAFGTATHYGANDVSASPQLAYSSFTAGKITGITLGNHGTSGYVQGTIYFLSGGTGTDPGAITATTVSGGQITAATLAYGGSGYANTQVLTVVGGSGDATVTVTGVQASCNLATWDKSLGGVGSWANAKKMLLAMNGHDQAGNTVALNPEYNLQNYFAYKEECYKFYNTALNGKGAQGTDPGFAPNSVDPAIGKITDNYILPGATPTVNGAGENIFTNQAGQVHKGGHGQLTLSSAPRICSDALDPCTALSGSPIVLAGQYYHFTANGPAPITWSVSGDTNSSITPQTGVYTRTGSPSGTITVTATNLNGSSSIVVLPSGVQTQPVITSDVVPPGVPMGGTHTFTASGGSIVWSVTGGGSINSSTGVYTPPTGVLPQDYSRGWQLLTNNSGYTTRIDTLPLAGRNAYWKAQWQGYNPPSNPNLQHSATWQMLPFSFFDNVIDNSELTRTVLNKEYYIDVFDHSTYTPPDQPWIQRADRFSQAGWNYRNGDGNDHHVFRLNKDTGIMYEGYQHFNDMSGFTWTAGNPTLVSFTSSRGAVEVPATPQQVWVSGGTGCWVAVNGGTTGLLAQVIDGQHYALPVDTSACGLPNAGIIMCSNREVSSDCVSSNTDINTQGSDIFHPYSNYIGWGADLGRSPISATSIHMQELYAAVARCRAASNCSTADLGHTIGLDSYKYLIGYPYVWPAMGNFGGPFYLNGCTNANPTVCSMHNGSINAAKPCVGSSTATQIPGCTFNVLFLNTVAVTNGSYQPDLTGPNWSTLNTCITTTFDPTCVMGNGNNGSATTNGAMLATMIDDTHFSLPIDTTTWGPITSVGSPYVFFDFTPMGSNFRLSTSLLNTSVCSGSSYCDYDYVILNTMRNYGLLLVDAIALSNPGWILRTDNSEFITLDMSLAQQAMRNYFNANAFDANIDVVNSASIIANKTARCSPQAPPTCPNDATSTVGQITVTATNSIGSASIDVIPEGTAVGINPEALSMVGGTTFQLMPWVSGNTTTTVTYSCCTSVDGVLPVITGVSVNSTGLITAPTSAQITTYLGANSNVMPQAILTITSVGDSNAKAYVHLDFWPADGSGAVRMLSAGNVTTFSGSWSPLYNDGTNIWPGGQFTAIPTLLSGAAYPLLGVNSAIILNIAAKIASWAGCVPAPCSDPGNLYWNAMEAVGTADMTRMLVLPSGQYRVTIYNPPPYTNLNYGKLGTTLFDWELQGTRVASYVDGWTQTGATVAATSTSDTHFFTGYKMTGIASVSALNGANGFLTQALRGRSGAVPYGITTSGLLIEPVSGSLTIQQAVLPKGIPNTAYSSMVQAYGGTAPYTYTVSAGTLPTGLSLGADGTVSGIPTTVGTSTFTVQATDNVSATATKSITLTIVGPVAPASQTLDGVKLQGSKL